MLTIVKLIKSIQQVGDMGKDSGPCFNENGLVDVVKQCIIL